MRLPACHSSACCFWQICFPPLAGQINFDQYLLWIINDEIPDINDHGINECTKSSHSAFTILWAQAKHHACTSLWTQIVNLNGDFLPADSEPHVLVTFGLKQPWFTFERKDEFNLLVNGIENVSEPLQKLNHPYFARLNLVWLLIHLSCWWWIVVISWF